jgi:N-acyl-D-amino-acid deacylase
MLGRPLDFDPGQRYAYSNFGYCLLGRIVEAVTRQPYQAWTQRHVLEPAGITDMRVGATQASGRAPGEAHYYMADGQTSRSVFPDDTEPVAWPYGGFHLEAMDAHGAWIASALDLAKFGSALFDAHPRPLLGPRALKLMTEPPAPPVARDEEGRLQRTYYACGWSVRSLDNPSTLNCWHAGSLPGTASLLVRRADGVGYAALLNQRSSGSMPSDQALDGLLYRAADAVKDWPEDSPEL